MTDQPDTEHLAHIALASAYQADCLAMCARLIRGGVYRPVRAYQALGRRTPDDAVSYIAQLVSSGTTEGLGRLAEIGMVADSFEASTLNPRWARLFNTDTRLAARTRLRDVAVTHPDVAVEVAQLLATERIQFDLQAAFDLASMPYKQPLNNR
jgi:hypothetical protein